MVPPSSKSAVSSGSGLTVGRDRVDVYAQLAKVLFKNLFGTELTFREEPQTDMLGAFMEAWVSLESLLFRIIAQEELPEVETSGALSNPLLRIQVLEGRGLLQPRMGAEIEELRSVRNKVVHGLGDYKTLVNSDLVLRTKKLALELERKRDELRLRRRNRTR